MSDIPLKATVSGTDGEVGTTTAVIIDPVRQNVTHIVVRRSGYDERCVPLDHIVGTDHDSVTLDISNEQLEKLPLFKEVEYIPGIPEYSGFEGGGWMVPYVTADYGVEPMEVEKVPAGELAVHRGDPVKATDGQVGTVGEFLIDAASGHISHLVLQKGHLWGKREVTIGMDIVDRVEGGTVFLKVDKDAVDQLPAVKIKRHYPWEHDD